MYVGSIEPQSSLKPRLLTKNRQDMVGKRERQSETRPLGNKYSPYIYRALTIYIIFSVPPPRAENRNGQHPNQSRTFSSPTPREPQIQSNDDREGSSSNTSTSVIC